MEHTKLLSLMFWLLLGGGGGGGENIHVNRRYKYNYCMDLQCQARGGGYIEGT